VPELIGARPSDLAGLLEGMVAANARMASGGLNPVLQAAAVAYGFVTTHPFKDGNGRLHRFLVHHVLAERGFDMADQRVSLLIRFVRQNGGQLAKGRRQKEFASLCDDEVEAVERVIAKAYGAEGIGPEG
jgi:fido (protein-threonine AMPylation protein)